MNRYVYMGYEQDDETTDEDDLNKSESDSESAKNHVNKSNVFEASMNNNLSSLMTNLMVNEKSSGQLVEDESDTDSEKEEETGERVKIKRKHYTNDELLYDPEADDLDQEWLESQRNITSKVKASITTDAILNCPCCMTLLCTDCQRHETYNTQYRAMFVFNCKIDVQEVLKYASKTKEKKQTPRENEYQAVYCEICNTKVAVYEPKDEIYHFFNVLSSHS